MNFDDAVTFVLAREGRYSADIDDPGGETKWGISKRAYPNEDIFNLTLERAMEIYRKDYWDILPDLPPAAKMVAFDAAVNQGRKFASEMIGKCGDDATAMLFYRLKRYSEIVKARPASLKFLRGWMNRMIELYGAIKEQL